MITQQQALEALQSKTESAKRGHRDANGAFVTYDGAAADLNALARYVTTLESVLRQYIEQGAQPGADKTIKHVAAWFDARCDTKYSGRFVGAEIYRALREDAALSAAPQPRQEQSK